ncbi:MAG: response regulator [Pyrinomonadaceae bacterium]|nr:response regulator [Pyrinomonadaceae bacterium]
MKKVETQRQVLFVEDTSDTRDLVEFSLKQDGFEVVTAQTAEEGLTQARSKSFALIMLDIGLPDKDGLELCREIRRFDQQTPILFYTAFAELLDMNEAAKAGAQGCLRKPEDTPRLGEIARRLIEETRQPKET